MMAEAFQMTGTADGQKTSSDGHVQKRMFLKQCGASSHVDNRAPLFNLEKGKKVKRKIVETMIDQNIITKKTKYVCKECIQKVEAIPSCSQVHGVKIKQTADSNSEKVVFDNIDSVLDLMKTDIARLYRDNEKCSISNLLSYNAEMWLDDRPKYLVGLLRKLCGFNSCSEQADSLQIAKVIEIIYSCRNKNIVLPLSFQENLLTFAISRNKQRVNYNSKVSPAGCDKTIARWILQQASSPISFPEGLVRCVFDNEQVVGKSYKIKADSKIPISVVTSHMYIVLDENSTLQSNENIAPNKWLFEKPSGVQKESFLTNDLELYKDKFRQTRNDLISHRLTQNEGNLDEVSSFILEKEQSVSEKICIECGGENEKNSRKCTNCGGLLASGTVNFEKYKHSFNPYYHFRHEEINENAFAVKTGEPDLLNPSSFENISQILYNLGARSGIMGNGDRKWLFLECDGGIYSIVEKLLFNVFSCSRCNEAFYGMVAFADHTCSILYNSLPNSHEFGWVIPMPGLLHIEINACKAFFELNWEVFLENVCFELGFKTPKALECAKKCTDHHKTFKILEILYIALVDELLFPFMLHCRERNIDHTVENYWLWSSEHVRNPCNIYCQQIAFTFLHSIMVFRVGCRKANTNLILAGRQRMSLLFYCRHHPRYQRIMAMNAYIENMMPLSLKEIMFNSFTLSRKNNVGHYQGGDACLEEINKEAKCWVSPVGVPTEDEWVKVFRNLDALSTIKNNLLCPNSETTFKSNDETTIDMAEVIPVRALFREYLAQPTVEVPHISMCGNKLLSTHLSNITAEAEEMRSQYHNCFLSGEQTKLPVVYVTEEEAKNSMQVENLSKENIRKKIFMLLEKMPDNKKKLMEEVFNKTVKLKTKIDYIVFYYTVLEDTAALD